MEPFTVSAINSAWPSPTVPLSLWRLLDRRDKTTFCPMLSFSPRQFPQPEGHRYYCEAGQHGQLEPDVNPSRQ